MIEAKELPFPLCEYRARLERVRARMAEEGLDLLLIHGLSDQCYLTGYQTFDQVGYRCFFLPVEGEPAIEVWKTEAEGVRLNAWVEEIVPWETGADPFAVTRRILQERGWTGGRIGVDEEALTLGGYRRLRDAVGRAELVNLTHFVSAVRLVKTPREVEMIRRAWRVLRGIALRCTRALTGVQNSGCVNAITSWIVTTDGSDIKLGSAYVGPWKTSQRSRYALRCSAGSLAWGSSCCMPRLRSCVGPKRYAYSRTTIGATCRRFCLPYHKPRC